MLVKRIFLAVASVALVIFLSLQTYDNLPKKNQLPLNVETKEGMAGTHCYAMVAGTGEEKQVLASLAMLKGPALAVFTSPMFEALEREQLPSDVLNLIDVTKKIQLTHDVQHVVVVGDIYVPVEHRGHGFAKKLIAHVCKQALDEGAKLIVLIPDPFEYEQGVQKSLQKSSDYEEKKERLVELYETCGFEVDHAGSLLYMYRQA